MPKVNKIFRDIPITFWFIWILGIGLIGGVSFLLGDQFTPISPFDHRILFFSLALVFSLIFWFSIAIFRFARKIKELEYKVTMAETQIDEAHKQKEAVLQISQKFADANDENEVIQLVLKLSLELAGAKGASYVPFDERGQPLTAYSKGESPFPVANDWIEYLASPEVRDRCGKCQAHVGTIDRCPLLKGAFLEGVGMFCFPVSRGDREFGILNLYLSNEEQLETQKKEFLQAIIDETSLAVESLRLRQRELKVINQIQAVRQKADLQDTLESLLDNSRQTMESDFACLEIGHHETRVPRILLFSGNIPESIEPIILGIVQGVISSGKPLILGEVAGEPGVDQEIKAILVSPCISNQQKPIGALLVGNLRSRHFSHRQLALIQMIANQISLIVQNAELMADVEFNSMMNERYRLAREIHDGLAQTIGFLKLQVAQMKNYLDRKDLTGLSQSIDVSYSTLADAYLDARLAIDELRIMPGRTNIFDWLQQISEEFEDATGIKVGVVNCHMEQVFAAEIQAQLIRIIQEALNNIRKHAKAHNVVIRCKSDEDFCLEIEDDGIGFFPEDVSEPSRHGLIGMKERAELLGADFQIISKPGHGTVIRLQIPMKTIIPE